MASIFNDKAIGRVVKRLQSKFPGVGPVTVRTTVADCLGATTLPQDCLGVEIVTLYRDEAGLGDNWRQRLFILAVGLGILADARFDERSAGRVDFLAVTMPKTRLLMLLRVPTKHFE